MNYYDAMKACEAQLDISESPQADARYLLQAVLQKSYSYILTWPEKMLSNAEVERLHSFIARRKAGEPVAYIIGTQEFWGMTLTVNAATLIPRADTEVLVESVIRLVEGSDIDCIDLGTGSGAIALALKTEKPSWRVIGLDQSEHALAVAKNNGKQLGLKVEWLKSNWLALVDQSSVDVMVANPPYIEAEDKHLELGDVRFEPKTALVSGADGLDDIRKIVRQSIRCLRARGWLFFEHGYNQKQAVADIMSQSGYTGIGHCQDYGGNDRVTFGRLPPA